MKKYLKILGSVVLVLALLYIGLRYQGFLYTYDYKVKISKEKVVEWCKRNKIDPSIAEGPSVLDADGKVGHFEWIIPSGNHNQNPVIVGVWVNIDGSLELYSGER